MPINMPVQMEWPFLTRWYYNIQNCNFCEVDVVPFSLLIPWPQLEKYPGDFLSSGINFHDSLYLALQEQYQ